jgi:Skp family chaperone for outer membrane proteins
MLPGRARAEEMGKRIGVVNVARVFAAYGKVKDVQEKMEKQFDAERKAIEKAGLELKRRQTGIETDPRNPKVDVAFFREVQAFELDKMELENRFQKLAQQVEEQRKTEMKGVLNDIKNAIRIVGTAERYDLVLRAPEFDDEFDPAKVSPKEKEEKDKNEPQSAAELVRKFRENPVLFFASGVDVTQKVIEKLNADYKPGAPK